MTEAQNKQIWRLIITSKIIAVIFITAAIGLFLIVISETDEISWIFVGVKIIALITMIIVGWVGLTADEVAAKLNRIRKARLGKI